MSGNTNEIDIIGLAAAAKALGYDSPAQVIARLEAIIKRNEAYVHRPYRQFRSGGYNEAVKEDNKVLALCVVMLESLTS